jgi:DNA-directed RNA polymerase subunit RPC12/RpoP
MLMTEVKCSWCDFEFLENEEELALSCIKCGKEEYLMDLGEVEV